jgi:hypothetical protein
MKPTMLLSQHQQESPGIDQLAVELVLRIFCGGVRDTKMFVGKCTNYINY